MDGVCKGESKGNDVEDDEDWVSFLNSDSIGQLICLATIKGWQGQQSGEETIVRGLREHMMHVRSCQKKYGSHQRTFAALDAAIDFALRKGAASL